MPHPGRGKAAFDEQQLNHVAKLLSFGRLECRHFCDSGMASTRSKAILPVQPTRGWHRSWPHVEASSSQRAYVPIAACLAASVSAILHGRLGFAESQSVQLARI